MYQAITRALLFAFAELKYKWMYQSKLSIWHAPRMHS